MSDPRHLLGPALTEAIEKLVEERVEALLDARLAEHEDGRWLTGARQAGAYLGCSPRRVYGKLDLIPHSKEEGRLIFHTRDLDAYRRGLS